MAAKKNFSIDEAVKFGWGVMKANFWFFAGILIIYWLLYFIPGLLTQALKGKSNFLIFLVNAVGFVFQTAALMGIFQICLKLCDRKKGEMSDLFSCFHLWLNYVLGAILYSLIVLAGMILLLVPGFIWGIQFQYFGLAVIDKGVGPIEALKISSAVTKGVKWRLFGFGIVLSLINLLGLLAFGLGLFAAVPVTMIAMVSVYRQLLSQAEGVQSPPAAGAPAEIPPA